MNINFELYKTFYCVAREGSISKGADKLSISQPAVTQAIRTLEDELDCKLFIRTPKGVTLTEEGKVLFSYVSEGMMYFINGGNKLSELKKLESGVLRIGATTSIAKNYLMPYLKKFNELYPSVNINIINELSGNLVKELRNGNLDIIVTSMSDNNDKDINYYKIKELHDIFVVGKKNDDKNYSLEDLLDNKLILQKEPSNTRMNFNSYLKINNLECNPKMEVVSHSLLVDLVENNFGVGLVTREYVLDKLDKTLFEISTNKNLPSRMLCYGIKDKYVSSFTVKKFIDILEKEL